EPEEENVETSTSSENEVENDPDVIAATAAILNAEAILAQHEAEIQEAFDQNKVLDEEIRAMEQRRSDLKRQQAEVIQRGQCSRSCEAIQKREKETAEHRRAVAREAFFPRQKLAQSSSEREELAKDKGYWTGVDGK